MEVRDEIALQILAHWCLDYVKLMNSSILSAQSSQKEQACCDILLKRDYLMGLLLAFTCSIAVRNRNKVLTHFWVSFRCLE